MNPAPPVTSILLMSGNGGNLVVPVNDMVLLGTSSYGVNIPLESGVAPSIFDSKKIQECGGAYVLQMPRV